MTNKEILNGMDEEKKSALAKALAATADAAEAAKVLSDAGIEVSDGEIVKHIEFGADGKAELGDDELAGIAAGAWYSTQVKATPEEVVMHCSVGQVVEVQVSWGFSWTQRCTVTDTRVSRFTSAGGNASPGSLDYYYDEYYVVPTEDHWYFHGGWVNGDRIQK